MISLFLAAALSSNRAAASCGDYLHRRHVPSVMQHSAEPISRDTAADVTRPVSHPPTRPCSGPECGKAPLPLPIVAPIQSSRPDAGLPERYLAASREQGSTFPAMAACDARAERGFPRLIDVPPELLC